MAKLRSALAAVALAGGTLAGTAAYSGESSVGRSDNVTTELLLSAAQAAPGETVTVLFRQTIRDGWHTYWKNPGDSGQETAVEWTLPEGSAVTPLQWATPKRFAFGDLVSYGYGPEAFLRADVTVPADWTAGRDYPIAAHVTWLACEKICIPEEARLVASVPTAAETAPDPAVAAAFEAGRNAMPSQAPGAAGYALNDRTLTLAVALPASTVSDKRAYFFADRWGVVAHSGSQQVDRDGDTLHITLPRGEGPLEGNLTGVLRFGDPSAHDPAPVAFAIDAGPDPSIVPAAAASAGTASGIAGRLAGGPGALADPGLAMMLLLAFAGGVLLNLMPCVFPVLAVKALGLVKGASGAASARLKGGLAYTGGVLVAFAAVGAAFLVLRAGGAAIGWGFQLQNPIVVAILAYVLFLVGLNLAGVFEVRGAWTGIGQQLAARSGTAGSFFTGVLAAVVAAPCTAPFMAAALGFAFTQPAPVAMAAILALGLGLAAPYLLLTASPALARRLPRPGPWMPAFKQILAFPMFASAAWLVWVLAQQTNPDAVLMTLLGFTALGLAAWLAGRERRIARGAAVVSVAAALWLALSVPQPAVAPAAAVTAPRISEPFSPVRLDALRAEGRPVLVNMTAAWCITCKVNERVALSGAAFERAVQQSRTAYLVGDWTRQDPDITEMLRRFDRAGVPLYVLFYPDDRPPLVLPQILAPETVTAALAAI